MTKRKIFLFFYNIEQYIMYVLLALMGITMFMQIFCRYFLNMPLIFPEELARVFFIWMTMVGTGYCIKHNLNAKVTALLDRCPKKLQKALLVLDDLICLGIFVYLLPTTIEFMGTQTKVTLPALQLPMFYLYLALLVAIILMCIRFPIHIYETISGKPLVKEEEEPPVTEGEETLITEVEE